MFLLICSSVFAATFYSWRYRSAATDCTALTDGKTRDLCYEIDDETMYKCQPDAGDCTGTEWKEVAGGSGGSGDVTSVGDCTTGACLDGTSDGGTYIKFYDAQGAGQFITGNLTAARVWTLPDATGTVALTTSNVATASALASNPAAATAGSVITNIAADGSVEAEVDVWTEAENTAAGYTSTADEVGTLNTGDLCINDGSDVQCTVNTIAELETALDATNITTSTELATGLATQDTCAEITNCVPSAFNNITDFSGTLTNTKYCIYTTGIGFVCNSEGGAGYTNLTSFVDQTAWRVFYSNTDGDVTELALGASGTYLKSNGATSAPTFAVPTGAVHDAVTLDANADAILDLSTQEVGLNTQNANKVFAGPGSGDDAVPAFRILVLNDIPSLVSLYSSAGHAHEGAYQPLSAVLTTYAGIDPSANAQSLLVETFSQMRDSLDVEIGSDVQAYAANLSEWSGVDPSTNGKSLVEAVDYAAMKALIDTDDIQTLTGIAAGVAHLGAFTGKTIADSVTIKAALQALETEVETKGAVAGQVWLGTHDFDGAFVTLPSTIGTTEGMTRWSSEGEAIEVNADGVKKAISVWGIIDKTLWDPDGIQSTEDAVPLMYVHPTKYPYGITLGSTDGITNSGIQLFADQANTAAPAIEEWSYTGEYISEIATITFANSTVASTTAPLSDASVAAGNRIFIDLDDTDLNWVEPAIPWYANPKP